MKKAISFLAITCMSLCLCSCGSKPKYETVDYTFLINAYKESNFEYKLFDYSSTEYCYSYKYYFIISNKDDSAYFYVFDDVESAKEYKKDNEWNLILWFYSFISGDPTWVNCDRYENIVVTYEKGSLIKPFKDSL